MIYEQTQQAINALMPQILMNVHPKTRHESDVCDQLARTSTKIIVQLPTAHLPQHNTPAKQQQLEDDLKGFWEQCQARAEAHLKHNQGFSQNKSIRFQPTMAFLSILFKHWVLHQSGVRIPAVQNHPFAFEIMQQTLLSLKDKA